MATATAVLLGLFVCAAPAAPGKLSAAPPARLDVPRLELPELPRTDQLAAPAATQEETRRASGDRIDANAAPARVESVVHARDFERGTRRPRGEFAALEVARVPGRAPPFKTRLRLVGEEGARVRVGASLLGPDGNELLASKVEVAFAGERVDLVIDWEGFAVPRAGAHRLRVLIDGKPAGEFPLEVRGR